MTLGSFDIRDTTGPMGPVGSFMECEGVELDDVALYFDGAPYPIDAGGAGADGPPSTPSAPT